MEEIILNDAEILAAMWISQRLANETNKSFSDFLSQVLDIMTKAKQNDKKKAKRPVYCKPEFYKDKIAYSWVKGPDEVSTNSLSSGDMLAVIKLAMIASKQNNRPFTFTYDIALDMILKEKEKNKNEHRSNK